MDTQILLKGSIRKGILLFAIPLFFSNLFQTLYNTVDTVLIGHYLGDQSLAAIGAVAALFELIVGFCTGFGQGLGIIAGQNFGANDMKSLKHTIGLSILLSLVLSGLVTVVALALLPFLLNILQTPSEIYAEALSYISVIASGLIITMFYNLCAGMLRAIGDSLTPLVILFISALINVGLDIYFIVGLNLGVAGTAYATLSAQLVSLIICLFWIYKKVPILMVQKSDFKWDKASVMLLGATGLSMAFMSSIVSIGSVILQAGINNLGYLTISGHTAARKVQSITFMAGGSLMMALAAFVAQNTGAKQYDRLSQGISFCNRAGLVYSAACTLLMLVFGRFIIAAISGSSDPVVLNAGTQYVMINMPFLFVLIVLLNLRSSLQSMGIKGIPVMSSVIECVSKIIFTFAIIPFLGYFGVCICEPVIWIIMASYLEWNYKRNPMLLEHGITPGIWKNPVIDESKKQELCQAQA